MAQEAFDFAVIVALDEEAEYFAQVVKCGGLKRLGSFTFWPIEDTDWEHFGRGVIVSSGGKGAELAERTVKAAYAAFGIGSVANVGIAGRVDEELKLGFVIVPSSSHDVTSGGGKVGGTKSRVTFSLAPKERLVPGGLTELAHTHLKANSPYMQRINRRLQRRFPSSDLFPEGGIRVIGRPVACVPDVGSNDRYRQAVRSIHREIAGMEMESAGIIKAAEELRLPAVILRGLSDGADFKKSDLEVVTRGANRKLALEAAVYVLEAILQLDAKGKGRRQTRGISIARASDVLDDGWREDLESHEQVFSLLVHDAHGEEIAHPIEQLVRSLREGQAPLALLGEKGVGKTTLFQYLQRALIVDRPGAEADVVALVRISELETWSENPVDRKRTIDRDRTEQRLDAVREIVEQEAQNCTGTLFLLIDGLNRTGDVRVTLVADLLRGLSENKNIIVAISAENAEDGRRLFENVSIRFRCTFSIVPLDIDDSKSRELVRRFSNTVPLEERNSINLQHSDIYEEIRKKDVRALDVFVMARFFRDFLRQPYDSLGTLAQCYETFCKHELSEDRSMTDDERMVVLTSAASTAFDILISQTKTLWEVQDRDIALLISNHSSVTNYLVAFHVLNIVREAVSQQNYELANDCLRYIFPADVNAYQKQMMKADPGLEAAIVAFIKANIGTLETLALSHVAYLAGRVQHHRNEMVALLDGVDVAEAGESVPVTHNFRMFRRAVFISRSYLGDRSAELRYVDILLTDVDEAQFNRGFHMEYYGDFAYDPQGKMYGRDAGDMPCDRTFFRLLDRIHSQSPIVPLIELLTLLSLVQVRLHRGVLKQKHRDDVLGLLTSDRFQNVSAYPPKVRGYIARMKEDLATESFNLSTVLQEWNMLAQTARTGWLKRRRDASPELAGFWKGREIESVAEHELATLGLAVTFLDRAPLGIERYSKLRVLEMLLVHDLAESRLGDQLPENADVEAEMEAMWMYGAFATYRGVGNIWWMPERFEEFCKGHTIESQIARDLDRLQFMLQARIYRAGMSDESALECEKTAEKLTTDTVRNIWQNLLSGFPAPARFEPIPPLY